MKKLLGSVLALTLGITCATAVAGCSNTGDVGGESDAEIATKAINYVKSMYDKTTLYETNADYDVIKQYSYSGIVYDIDWTLSSVSATSNDINDYLTIVDQDELKYTVSVEARPMEDIEYYLTASVKVGNETASHSIKKKLVGLGDVMTPSQVNEIGKKLESGKYYTENGAAKRITVAGYVINPGSYNYNSGKPRYDQIYIAEEYTRELDKTAANVLYVYRVSADSKFLTGYGALEKGDYAVFSGYLQNYNGLIELTYNGSDNAQCVALEKAKISDEQKVEAANDTLALSRTKFTEISEITLPATSCGATLSWALATTTDLVTLTGNTLKVVKIPEATEDIKLTVTISCGSVTPVTKEITITVAPPVSLDHAGTEDDPLSVADVQALFATLASGEIYQVGGVDKMFYIKGYVTAVGTINGSYGLKDVYIADKAGASKEDSILIFNLNWGVLPTGSNPLAEGDELVLTGFLKNHYGTYEVAQSGSTYPAATSWKSSLTDEEKVAKALEAVPETVTINKAGATPLPLASYGVLFLWTGDSETYPVSGGMVTVNELPTEDASFSATVTASYGNVKQTKTITVTVKAYVPDAKGTITNPYTPSEAIELAKTLADNAYYSENGTPVAIYVKGYVADAGYYDAGYKNFNKIYIADEYTEGMGTEGALYVFRVQPDDTYLKGDGDLDVGDLVTFVGYLQNYKGNNGNTIELTYNNNVSENKNVVCVALEKVTLTPADQIAKALAKVADTLTVATAGETELPASIVKGVTFEWAVKSGTAATVANGKLNVAELPAEDATVVLTVTATCDGISSTKDVTVTIKAEAKLPDDAVTVSLSFADTANRTEGVTDQSSGKQVWEQNGIKFTNEGNVNIQYYNPVRIYKNTSIKIEYTGIIKIVFHSAAADSNKNYPVALVTSLEAAFPGAVITSVDNDVTIVFASAVNSVEFTASADQLRFNSIDVTASASSAGPDVPEHTHNWSYAHVDGSMNHTRTCSAAGCDVGTETVACVPELNVCPDCKYEYKEAEILNALFALSAGQALNGTYKLTGEISAIDEISTNFKNSTFTIKVGEKEVIVFRANSSNYADIKLGDTVTVTGTLKNYSGKFEFDSGCKIIEIVHAVDTRTDAEKVAAALEKVEATLTVSAAGSTTLPVSSEADVTFEWTVAQGTPAYVTITADGKLHVESLPAEQATVTIIVTASCNTASDKKEVTVTIKAASVVNPGEESALTLTKDTLFPGLTGTSYATYNGEHTVGEYVVTTSNVLGNTYGGNAVLQFKASAGTMTLDGEFTKIVIIVAATYAYDSLNKITVYAGATALTPTLLNTENTGAKENNYEVMLHTIEYTVTGTGVQTIKFAKENAGAGYLTSITFFGNEGGNSGNTPGGENKPGEGALVATFNLGENGEEKHVDGSAATTYTETSGNYTLDVTAGEKLFTGAVDAKGNSCLKLGTSSLTGSFTFTVANDVTKVVIYVACYKANKTNVTVNVGEVIAVETLSNDGEYTAIEIDTTTTKTITFSTANGGVRCMVNTIEFYA